jgi:voltage-dependent calcium channel T type alpha-1G
VTVINEWLASRDWLILFCRWNQLDIFIVILSIVGIILEEMKTNVIPINPTIIRVMRVLRIARGKIVWVLTMFERSKIIS